MLSQRSFSWIAAIFLAFTPAVIRGSNDTVRFETWYPFLKGNKWGFIDAQGYWKVEPAFDRLGDVFDHDLVRVWIGNQCGYIDRKGGWFVKPEFDNLSPSFADADFQAVSHEKKWGILSREKGLLLSPRYDEIVLSSDRAWVREGDHLGVFGLDGKWIQPATINWPSTWTMPAPLNADHVAWFRENKATNGKWGLINSEGRILCQPLFESHPEIGKEPAPWPFQPDGTDFAKGRAWVRENGEFELLSADGTIGHKEPFMTMAPWSGELAVFTDSSGRTGLISTQGEVVFPPIEGEIEKPIDGLARYHIHRHETTPGHDPVTQTLNGYLDSSGKTIVPAGKYGGLGDLSEGLITAVTYPEYLPNGSYTRRRIAFLDRQGNEVIKLEGDYDAGPFCEGLAAVQEAVDEGPGRAQEGGKWGYIDKTGTFKIHPQYDGASRFCGKLAWVFVETDNNRGNSHALIDNMGKLLTDFRYYPPEHARGELNVEPSKLPDLRWRGDLALVGGKRFLGLAQRDGKIIVGPCYDYIGLPHDGLMAVSTWYEKDSSGFWLGYKAGFLDEKGTEVVPLGTYTQVTDFEHGCAWVSNSYSDAKEKKQKRGWTLIDTRGKSLTDESYINPGVLAKNYWNEVPDFVGDLACVAPARSFQEGRRASLAREEWGYIDHSGHVIVWHQPAAR